MAILAAVSSGAIIWQYVLSRGTAADERKVSDISSLQLSVDEYAQKEGEAPKTLQSLNIEGSLTKRLSDYEYSYSDETFTICTTFATDTSVEGFNSTPESPYWHKKGRQCFTSDIYIYNDYYNSPEASPLDSSDNYDFNSYR